MTYHDEGDGKTDEEIVRLTLANQAYFLHIIKRYEKKIYRYICRLTNVRDEDAEDILQDIFIKTYLNLNDFDSELKFSSWIYRIAHNEVISHHRKVQARPQGHSLEMEDDTVKRLAADLDLAKNMDLKILRENISAIMLGLEDKHREILVLKFFEGKSYQEISDIIKKPMGTVASLMNKAKTEFKRETEKQDIKL
jgi:RNA polymerase sigma-70 factor, ECF subfamily